jgi:hypothetical protein
VGERSVSLLNHPTHLVQAEAEGCPGPTLHFRAASGLVWRCLIVKQIEDKTICEKKTGNLIEDLWVSLNRQV